MDAALEEETVARELWKTMAIAIKSTELFWHPTLKKLAHLHDRDWLVSFEGEAFSGGGYRITGVENVCRKPVLAVAIPPQPPAHAPEPDDPTGAKVTAAREALAALWPKGIPAGLMAKDRENEIVSWCEEHGRSVPSVRTIQLALKARVA